MITLYYFVVFLIALRKIFSAIRNMLPNKKRDEKRDRLFNSAIENYKMAVDENIDARERMEQSFSFTSKIPRIKLSVIEDIWIVLGLFSRYSYLFWIYICVVLFNISMLMLGVYRQGFSISPQQRKALSVVIPTLEAAILLFITNKYFNFIEIFNGVFK